MPNCAQARGTPHAQQYTFLRRTTCNVDSDEPWGQVDHHDVRLRRNYTGRKRAIDNAREDGRLLVILNQVREVVIETVERSSGEHSTLTHSSAESAPYLHSAVVQPRAECDDGTRGRPESL
ncbi:MAG TPA: hypothetical protein VJ717_05410 [Gemmatimonadaceae bacterium]|nr:hypothetical protein [Gemmatimonadaceae bacterium]